MNHINCIIVDDEPLALDILQDYISKVTILKLAGRCETAVEALQIMQDQDIQLLFLDINMPDISGIQFLRSLKNKPAVILTTAFREYAIEGFDLEVLDYLLKPIEFDRFLKAVNKANDYIRQRNTSNPSDHDFLFVRADYKLVKIKFDDILYVEAVKDYIKIRTGKTQVLTLMSMSSIEEKLPEENFIRVHRSYIISLSGITSISRHRILIDDKYIPVSTPYREKFYEVIRHFS